MNNDLISRSELTKELRERLVACNDWEEKAKDKETRIRANAVKTFICEMFMLLKEFPTVEVTEEQAIDKLHETGWLIRHDKEMTERPQGEWIEIPVKRDLLYNTGIKYTCSICDKGNCYGKPPFCMYCGADMRGKKIQTPSCLTNPERHEELLERYKEGEDGES